MAAHAASEVPGHGRQPAAPAGDPILAAKITAPKVPAWAVQRPRITKLIAEGTRWCPLTVVTGPPGAGKTIALALWTASAPGPVSWVCLDDFDNRPGAFWSYVVAALRRSGVAIPKAVRAVRPGRAGEDRFLLRLTAALAAQDPAVTLVLDDLHVLTDPGVLKELEFVLRNAGSGLRLAVTSRMDPLLALHRYRLAGQLTEIRAGDLAFSVDEAGQLLNQHAGRLTQDALENLTQRTEGWAAGLRLAAISLSTHPDPGQFVKELLAEDSALIDYLVDEALDVQPPQVREVLLSTSILEQVNPDAAVALTGDELAAGILMDLAHTNAFVQPIGSGWYRYHTLFAEILRAKLRYEHPDRVISLHQRAARWYQRSGLLTDAVRHAAGVGDWPLAAGIVLDELAIGQLIEPGEDQSLAREFADMPPGPAQAGPAQALVAAAMALSAGRPQSCASALDAADAMLARCPAGEQVTARLAAAVVRLAASLRTGDLTAATSAASHAEVMLGLIPAGKLGRHPDLGSRVLAGRGAVELWSGDLDQAVRLLGAGLASGAEGQRATVAGQLALAEALRGRLDRAAELAIRLASPAGEHPPPGSGLAPLIALAWVHLERHELRQTRGLLKQADTALAICPDRLLGTVAYLVAVGGALAEGRAEVAGEIIARARSGWTVPAWLDQQLCLAESRVCAAVGDTQAALTAAERAGDCAAPEVAVNLANALAAAGDAGQAQRLLAPVLAADSAVPDRVRLQAWLVDVRLSVAAGDDGARGRRSLAAALRLAEREHLRLPFVIERGRLGAVLRRAPGLAETHRRLLAPVHGPGQLPASVQVPARAPAVLVEPLTEREREVLVHVSGMLSTAEIASEMYISVNTVKTHLRSIYRKLGSAHRGEAVRRARELQLI